MAHYEDQRERELDRNEINYKAQARSKVLEFINNADDGDFIFLDSIIRNRKHIKDFLSGLRGIQGILL